MIDKYSTFHISVLGCASKYLKLKCIMYKLSQCLFSPTNIGIPYMYFMAYLKNVIVSYSVYSCPHESPFLVWHMRDIYHVPDHRQFNHISCSFHPEVFIFDHYPSCIEVTTSNDIVFLIVIKNINHLYINEFILFVFRKYQILHFHIILRIKCIHHYLRFNGF